MLLLLKRNRDKLLVLTIFGVEKRVLFVRTRRFLYQGGRVSEILVCCAMAKVPVAGNDPKNGPFQGQGLIATPVPAGPGAGATPSGAAGPHSSASNNHLLVAIAGGFSDWFANEEEAMRATGAKVLLRCSTHVPGNLPTETSTASVVITRPVVLDNEFTDPTPKDDLVHSRIPLPTTPAKRPCLPVASTSAIRKSERKPKPLV